MTMDGIPGPCGGCGLSYGAGHLDDCPIFGSRAMHRSQELDDVLMMFDLDTPELDDVLIEYRDALVAFRGHRDKDTELRVERAGQQVLNVLQRYL